MGAWSSDNKTSVATMGVRRLPAQRQSVIIPADDTLTITHRHRRRPRPCSRTGCGLAGEVVDGTFINAAALDTFLAEQVARPKPRMCSSRSTSRRR